MLRSARHGCPPAHCTWILELLSLTWHCLIPTPIPVMSLRPSVINLLQCEGVSAKKGQHDQMMTFVLHAQQNGKGTRVHAALLTSLYCRSSALIRGPFGWPKLVRNLSSTPHPLDMLGPTAILRLTS